MKGRILINLVLLVLTTQLTSCGSSDFFEQSLGTPNITDAGDPPGAEWGFEDPGREILSDDFTKKDDEEALPLDIAWVVDNSGSMSNEQQALADNFSVFINNFVTKDIDFKMAITTTDSSIVAGSMDDLSSDDYASAPSQFISDFQSMINVGTRGSGYEKGLKGMDDLLDSHAGFLDQKQV